MTRQEFIEKAVQVLKAPKGSVQAKIEFLKDKGMTDLEVTEALNQVTNGEIVRSAFVNL